MKIQSTDDNPILSVGCCNFETEWGDKKANLSKIVLLTTKASEIGCDIIIFPELALTGYECENTKGCTSKGPHKALAEEIPGPSTKVIENIARGRKISVIFGLAEKDSEGSRIYDSAVFIGPEGIVGTYRKLNLAPPPIWTEQFCFTGGANKMKEIPVFKSSKFVVGISICYDFYKFPEIARIQCLKGANLLVNPSASASAPGGEPQPHLQVITGARATENNCYAASANLVGKERTRSFYGNSVIAGPDVYRQTRFYAVGGSGEEIVTSSLSLRKLDFIRSRVPLTTDRKKYSSELISKEMERLS